MTFASPWMLLGLLAIPVLVGVYLLRNRSRRLNVSSLILWEDQRSAKRGGRTVERLQTPLSLFLEILALALFALAAAGPTWSSSSAARSLIIVLDDSYSMLAQSDDKNPRQQAEVALLEECRREAFEVRLILAGSQPRLLGELLDRPDQLRESLTQWKCKSPTADIAKAMTLAQEVGGPHAKVLILTDHAPLEAMEGGKIEWWSFGKSVPNWAFTTATRTVHRGQERVLLEVSNHSAASGRTELSLEGAGQSVSRTSVLELPSGGKKRLIFTLPSGSSPLIARLGKDALSIDNEVVLLSPSARLLRVHIELKDETLRRAVERAMESTGETTLTAKRADLRISDSIAPLESATWGLDFLGDDDATPYTGPFVIDRTHPLARGLSLQSAIWSASPRASLRGLPLIMAGNIPLLSEEIDPAGRHRWQMSFVAKHSNLQDLQDWPILMANMVGRRRQGLPGILEPNVRLGESVRVTVPDGTDEVIHTLPESSNEKRSQTIAVRSEHIILLPEEVGVHLVKTKDEEYRFACNALSADESNLTRQETRQFGEWDSSFIQRERSVNLGPYLLLLALAVLSGHLAIVVARGARA